MKKLEKSPVNNCPEWSDKGLTGRPVESCWINLFASGGLLRLEV